MLRRKAEKYLIELIGYFPAVAIVGPRQVGKTTLAKLLIKKIKKPFVYLDLELSSDYNKLKDPQLFLEQYVDKCVIIDEVQRMPELFPLLRALIDKNRVPARFLLLGSASPDLIRDSSESLAGRIGYIELTPLNITEIKNKANSNLLWLRGGFPDALLAPTASLWQKWVSNFVKTYIERDLPMLGMPASPILTQRLWAMLSHLHGQELNYSNLAKSLEISVTSVKTYIDFLEQAFLIRRLQPYSMNTKKRLVKSPKLYIRDSGLLHYQNAIYSYDDLYNNILIGNSWEGYVIEQVYQLLADDFKLFFYRTSDGSELDIVFVKANTVVATAEIKHTSTPTLSRGNTISINDLKAKNNFIITKESEDYFLKENVRVCSLRTFLEKYLEKI
ncbi:MAG: ATP-binding protein [Bacteroidetes bacterium]|nr:ATP-binding protein [Bacteroidota bacterium]